MAPGYRNQSRRQTRTGYVDHDVFEGLPVRHWRRDYVTVAPPSTQENTTAQNDIWAVELPHGMPKDSHLLPQHSQDLLRAARSGRIYKRPPPVEEEEADPEAILGDKPEKKDDDPKERGFSARAWKQIPRHMEGPDVEYLAKRRKGLITISSKAVSTGPTLTKTTVRRTDAAGNEYVQDVIVPNGQQVEGDVISQTVIPDPKVAAPVEGGLALPTPPRRKGPPLRKSKKAPARGRKKKVLAPTSVPQAMQIDGVTQIVDGAGGVVGPDGVSIESDSVAAPSTTEDTEMADGSVAASDDDDGEDGEEGDEVDDDEGSVDAHDSPSKPPRPQSPMPNKLPAMKEIPHLGPTETRISGNDLVHGPLLSHIETREGKSGSPLKQVALTTSTLASPIKSPVTAEDSFSDIPPPQEPSDMPIAAELVKLDEAMQRETAETAPTKLPPPPPEPTVAEAVAAMEVRREEEEEEEEMLLDIVENGSNAQIGNNQNPIPLGIEIPSETTPSIQPLESTRSEQETLEPSEPQSEPTSIPVPVDDATAETEPQQSIEENDDSFPDLLGGLEAQANEPQPPIKTPVTPESGPEIIEKQLEPEEATDPAEAAEPEEAVEPEKPAEPQKSAEPEEATEPEKAVDPEPEVVGALGGKLENESEEKREEA